MPACVCVRVHLGIPGYTYTWVYPSIFKRSSTFRGSQHAGMSSVVYNVPTCQRSTKNNEASTDPTPEVHTSSPGCTQVVQRCTQSARNVPLVVLNVPLDFWKSDRYFFVNIPLLFCVKENIPLVFRKSNVVFFKSTVVFF